jgi:hypothetical protein
LGREPGIVKRTAIQVVDRAIGDHADNLPAGVRQGVNQAREYDGAAGLSDSDAFSASDDPAGGNRLVIGYVLNTVNDRRIQVPRMP